MLNGCRSRIGGDEQGPGRLTRPGPVRWLVPLAAAAAMVVAIGLVAVITAASHGRMAGTGSAASRAALAGTAPKFMVLVVDPGPAAPGTSSSLHVQVAATGRGLATVPSPAGTSWTAVTATGNNRDFVLAANPPSGQSCRSSLYRLRLTGSGKVASLTPLSVPTVTVGIMAGGLRASADGTTVAYAAMLCPQTRCTSTPRSRCHPGSSVTT